MLLTMIPCILGGYILIKTTMTTWIRCDSAQMNPELFPAEEKLFAKKETLVLSHKPPASSDKECPL